MTPRMSLRAAARERYRALTKVEQRETQGATIDAAALGQLGVTSPADTPLPSPPPQGGREQTPQGGREQTPQGGREQTLMQQVRALYEDSAVPVAEIARLVEVSERTLYKYVARGGWRRRYRTRDERARHADAGPAEDAAEKIAPRSPFAPVKGAGGRFIRREDAGKPHACGLKALDPAGERRAAVTCAEAAAISDHAQAGARAEAARFRALDQLTAALADLAKVCQSLSAARATPRAAPPTAGRFLRDGTYIPPAPECAPAPDPGANAAQLANAIAAAILRQIMALLPPPAAEDVVRTAAAPA